MIKFKCVCKSIKKSIKEKQKNEGSDKEKERVRRALGD